ncbi:hypothetical protein [Streptomyces sp. NPDC056304]|uniref:hypothetical protein n=1 Tax=Streptomyces sp. NPDC056304 TaxID=3345778 RepID=UPI0035D9D9EB
MTNRDLSSRLVSLRGHCVAQLSDAVTQWGKEVPEDPGVAELADLIEQTAADLDHPDEPRQAASADLAVATEKLRAAARLGGLLPAVTLWHLRGAVEQLSAVRRNLGAQAPAR